MSLLLDSSENIQNQPEARSYARPLPEGGNPFTTPAPAAESRNVPTPAPAPADETAQFAPSVRAALEVARSDNLDAARVARGLNIARNLGLPQSVVMADLDYARQEEVARKIEANPLLAGWAAKNEFNAAVVSGDVDRMKELCTALQKQHETWEATRPDMGIGERVLTLLGEGTRNVGLDLDSFLSASARWFSHGTLRDADGNELGDYEHAGMREWADRRDQEIARIKQAAGPELQAQTTLGGYLQDVVRQIPQLAAQIGATLAGGPAAGMALMGGQIAGDQYSKLMEHGVDPDRALAAGVANAVMQAPLEQLGLGRLAGIFKTSGLKNIAKRTAEGVLTEGGTEFLQAFPESATELWAKLAQDEGASDWYARFVEALPETARQGLYEAAVAAPFGVLGGMGKAAYDRAQQKRAEAFSAAQIALHEKVEATQAKKLEPEIIESVLAAGGMDQVVGVDAEALRTLHQEGRDFLTPLGLDLEDVETAAAAGQDVHLPLVRLHSRLNQEEITAIMPHVRQTPEAMNGAEAARVNEKIAADALKVAELFQGDTRLFEEMKEERQRLHAEAVEAIRRQPGLLAQAEASSGSVDAYVNDWLNMVQGFAYRMGASGQNPVELMRRITLDSLRAKRRAHMSQEEVIGEDLAELAPEAASQPAAQAAASAPIVHEGVETMEDLYALAEAALPGFQESITTIGDATGGTAHFRPGNGLKRPERVQRKIEQDYPTEGPKRVLDVLGGTLLYENRANVEAALPVIEQQIQAIGGSIVRVKNRFEKPSAGYKDYLLNIRMPNGMVTELLMTTKAMSDAKMGETGIGHDLYEAMQAAESVWNDKRATDTEKAEAWSYLIQLRRASKAYYDSTGAESNETASFSGIVEPLNIMSATGASNASSKLYPKIESFLGNIRNRPEFATAYGLSSYSMNSSMNTGSLAVPTSQGVPSEASRPSLNAVRTGGKEAGISEPPVGERNITPGSVQSNAANGRPEKIQGAETQILGKGTSEQARYEVWELDDVIPSHDPANGFARRAEYPASAQERPYHSDAGEQEKVRGNALSYQPAFVVNTDPTAGNGPPIITRDGIVLGGNSRTMTLQLVYADNAQGAEAYRTELAGKAAQFGIDPAGLATMRRPILVRVVDSDMALNDMAVKSRQYNQTTTQKLQAKAEGVSRARLLSSETLAELSAEMAEFDTLRQFFDSSKSRGFVQSLLRDGVLEQTEIASLTDSKTGRLNDSGKSLVENALRGLVVPDYDILADTPSSVLNKLDKVIPALAKLKARGEGWDLTGVIVPALRFVGAAAKENRKLEGWLGQADLMDTDPDKKRPAVQALALTFANATQKEVLARFDAFAAAAERQQKGMGLLMAQPEGSKPAPAFVKAFMRQLVSVDGKTMPDFDPAGNPRHAALLWAYEHGGKGKTVAAAMANLEKTMNGKKVPAEKKIEARERMSQLAEFSGTVAIYQPKLGQYFQYRQGQQLFQTAPATDSAAFKKWFGKSKVVDEHGAPLIVYHGTGATVGDDFGFDYKFLGKNGSAEGYGFYFTSNLNTAQGYQEEGGSLVKAYLALQKPMPVKQKPFSKAVLKKILKRAVEKEIEQFPDETPDYRDSFLSNYTDTYDMSFDRALNEAVNMIHDSETALEQIAEIANASGNKRGTAEAVRDVTGYDGIFANGYGDKGLEGGKIYVAWFPEQAKSIQNKGTWNPDDPRILYQPAYHGTPHRFDKFTLDHIGSGEGAQAHGWGLYFAADKAVSEEYRKNLNFKYRNSSEAKGQLYEVDIPENDVLLDEQKTLDKQSEAVREALEKGSDLMPDEEIQANMAEYLYQALEDGANITGRDLYRALSVLGTEDYEERLEVSRDGAQAASEFLNSLGIKGITYEGREDGRCFVVFDDKAINILQTYYQGGDDPRGSTQIYPETYLISLFNGADLSTLLHETGHVFFEEMERMVESGAADESLRRDYATMRDWLGANTGQPLTVEQREQAARGFEAYLMEGRAPTEELASAFARFRRWLLKIYQSAVRLNAPLTDEVRSVFDRMISTEREIAATAARNELLDLTARELDALGLTGTARETAGGLVSRGREAAAEALERARAENRKSRQAKYLREAWEEVREMQAYKARKALRQTPLDLEAVRDGYGEDTARALLKSLPGAARKEGGVDPEIFAAEQGYENATAMFADVLNARRQGDMVAGIVREKEARHDQAYDAFEHLMETREVAIQMELVGRKLAELLGVQSVEAEAYTRAAQKELASMPLGRAVQTGNFLAAMRRALQEQRTALLAGDRQKALLAHRKAALNMEFARQSRALARSREKLENGIKRFVGMKRGDPDARYMVMDIGARYGLCKFNARLAEGRDAATGRAWLKAAEADGYEIFPDETVLLGAGQPWRTMSVTDFESLTDTVAQIITVERNRRKLLTAQGKADLDETAESIAAAIYAHRQSKPFKTVEKQPAAVKALSGLHAIHTKIEALCLAVDGDRMGPAWEYIYRPITEADDRQAMRFREVRDALNSAPLFGAYTKKELAGMGTRRELVKEIGERLTWENRLAVALNMGNAVNIERIKTGHGWTDEQIAAVVKPLTSRDWNFVQAVWDYLGSFKEEAFALQEEVTGLRPTAVEAEPLTVQTSDGKTLNLAGGYYPIKYNGEKGNRAFAQTQKEMDKELFGGRNYGAAMTRTGHLKERDSGGLGTPLLLDLSVVTDHVFNVVHDLTYRKAVLDVAKIIRHKAVQKAFTDTVGPEMYRQLEPWLQDVAGERQEPMHQIHRWARWARASTSIMQMGFKVTTILAQPMGITQTAEMLGYKWTGVGLKRVYGNIRRLPELLRETYARSPFMANRMQSFDREVRDITKRLQPGLGRFGWLQVLKDKAFIPMGWVQMGVDLPTWWGAYAKGLQDFSGDETRAAHYADSIVRMSQGSGSTKDLARVQRGGELLRLTTMFYSYFNTFYQLAARRIVRLKEHHAPADIFMAANTALLLWFLPAVFGELLAGRGPDDDDEKWKWASMQILQYPFQSVVGVRDLANGIFGKFGYQITPAQSAPAAMVKWFKSVNKALEKEDVSLLARPTAEALGYAFSLPMKQPIITVGNLWNYLMGDDPDFAVRDLFFTKKKDRK